MMGRLTARIGHLGLWLLICILFPVSLWIFIGFGLRAAMRDRVPEKTAPSQPDELA